MDQQQVTQAATVLMAAMIDPNKKSDFPSLAKRALAGALALKEQIDAHYNRRGMVETGSQPLDGRNQEGQLPGPVEPSGHDTTS